MSAIDYSKWDKIDCSSSEDEDENIDNNNGPRVTRLDGPSRVTRTADGSIVVEEGQQQQQQQQPQDHQQSSVISNKTHSHSIQIENWTENGSEIVMEEDDVNKNFAYATTPTKKRRQKLFWSQDRYSVTIRLELPNNQIRGKDITMELQGVLPYRDRNSAVGNDNLASIKLTWNNPNDNNEINLLQGKFPHPIHAPEGEKVGEGEDNDLLLCDWSIDRVKMDCDDNNNNKAIEVAFFVITLPKAVPMEGIVIWWRRPLLQFAEIDAQQANPNNGTSKQAAFQKAWDEAHRQFREKAQQQKQSLE